MIEGEDGGPPVPETSEEDGSQGARVDTSPLPPSEIAARVPLAVALFAFLVFLPSLSSGFVFDDLPLIVRNGNVQSWGRLPHAFVTHLWDTQDLTLGLPAPPETLRYWRPLVTVSYGLNWLLGGPVPGHFHLVNVVLHTLASFFATRAGLRWTRSVPAALLVGLVFAVHPSHIENVVWIAGRTDLVMMVFVFAALEGFHAQAYATSAATRLRWSIFTVAAAAGALASKEPAVMLPLLLLAENAARAPSRRIHLDEIKTSPGRFWTAFVVTALCGGYAAFRSVIWPIAPQRIPFTLQPLEALSTIGEYLLRSLWPWPQSMHYYHVTSHGGVRQYVLWQVGLGALTLVGEVALLVYAFRRNRTAFWLLIAQLAFMGPLLNLLPTGLEDAVQDRYLYASLFLFVAALGALFPKPLGRLARVRAAKLAGVGAALIAAGLILARTVDYRDNETFWASELLTHPHHPRVLRTNAIFAALRGDERTAFELYKESVGPLSMSYAGYTQDADLVSVHFQEVALQAALLPDGELAALRALRAELGRLDPNQTAETEAPTVGSVGGIRLGRKLPAIEVANFGKEHRRWFLERDALLATRVGDLEGARRAISAIPAEEAANSGSALVGALARARVQPAVEVRAFVELVAAGSATPTKQALGSFRAQLAQAQKLAEAAEAAEAPQQPSLWALHDATLGAYALALRRVLDDPAADRELIVQLLVAMRLDSAAEREAAEVFGPRAPSVLDAMRAALPERLREAAPVETTDWRALIRTIPAPAAPSPAPRGSAP
jgi:hypothetical protein